MIKKLLVPVDFTDASAHAARVAVTIARRRLAPIDLIHVYPEPMEGTVAVEPMYLPPTLTERLDERRSISLTRRLEALRQELGGDGAGVVIEVSLHRGDAAEEIARLATSDDLIVLGASGGHWIGGTAETLIRSAPCPVLAVPPADPDAPPWEGFVRPLVAVDDADEDEPLARLVADLAGDDATLELIYAWGGDYPGGVEVALGGGGDRSGAVEKGRAAQARALEDYAASLDLGVATRCYLASGEAAAALLERADESDADLIAVGAHRPDDRAEPPQGIGERLLRFAHCAVLALPLARSDAS